MSIPNLSNSFKIGQTLAEILPTEADWCFSFLSFSSKKQMFNIAKVFVLPQHGEGSSLIQNVGGNISMLLFTQKRQKTSNQLTVKGSQTNRERA